MLLFNFLIAVSPPKKKNPNHKVSKYCTLLYANTMKNYIQL